MRRIALVNDLSGFGKCSINTQIPIISAFGDVPYTLLTSYLSNNTSYKSFHKVDMKDELSKVIKAWDDNGFAFEGIMTGYIGDPKNILDVKDFVVNQKIDNQSIVLVDPCFADDGQLYCSITDEHINNYKTLLEVGDFITPNMTEACMLTGEDYESKRVKLNLLSYERDDEGKDKEKLKHISEKIIEVLKPVIEKIIKKKKQTCLITGIKLFNSVVTILHIVDAGRDLIQTTFNFTNRFEDRPGTGDLFNAVFFETVINGYTYLDALNISSGFVSNALRFTIERKFRKEEGIIYEPILLDNINFIRQNTKRKGDDQNPNQNNNHKG